MQTCCDGLITMQPLNGNSLARLVHGNLPMATQKKCLAAFSKDLNTQNSSQPMG